MTESPKQQLQISAEVQVVEIGAQKGFLEQRSLLLSQLLHNADSEINSLKAQLDQVVSAGKISAAEEESLRVELADAKVHIDALQRQVFLLENPPIVLPEEPAAVAGLGIVPVAEASIVATPIEAETLTLADANIGTVDTGTVTGFTAGGPF